MYPRQNDTENNDAQDKPVCFFKGWKTIPPNTTIVLDYPNSDMCTLTFADESKRPVKAILCNHNGVTDCYYLEIADPENVYTEQKQQQSKGQRHFWYYQSPIDGSISNVISLKQMHKHNRLYNEQNGLITLQSGDEVHYVNEELTYSNDGTLTNLYGRRTELHFIISKNGIVIPAYSSDQAYNFVKNRSSALNQCISITNTKYYPSAIAQRALERKRLFYGADSEIPNPNAMAINTKKYTSSSQQLAAEFMEISSVSEFSRIVNSDMNANHVRRASKAKITNDAMQQPVEAMRQLVNAMQQPVAFRRSFQDIVEIILLIHQHANKFNITFGKALYICAKMESSYSDYQLFIEKCRNHDIQVAGYTSLQGLESGAFSIGRDSLNDNEYDYLLRRCASFNNIRLALNDTGRIVLCDANDPGLRPQHQQPFINQAAIPAMNSTTTTTTTTTNNSPLQQFNMLAGNNNRLQLGQTQPSFGISNDNNGLDQFYQENNGSIDQLKPWMMM